MKFLHISDLHLGKRVNEFSMLKDQNYILEQIRSIAGREQADGVIIAGDIYDKPVPPAEAVQVFDRFLTALAREGRKVYAVSGNHDSAERIAFGAALMREQGVYIAPVYDGNVEKITEHDAYGDICIYLLPFVKPATVRHVLTREQEEKAGAVQENEEANGQETAALTYDDAVRFAVERMEVDAAKRNILVAHQFVTGAGRCESEEVSVGGLDNVDAGIFERFDYVALGHIHTPQHIGRETVRYCGTPLKYSFSEAGQEKSVTVLEVKEKGDIVLSTVPLQPLHDMRKLRGTYREVMAAGGRAAKEADSMQEDYVEITLTDEQDILDGIQKLRTVYPNLMRLVYDNSRTRQNQTFTAAEEVERKSELELFAEFYELQNNGPMSREQEEFMRRLIETAREKQEGQP